MVDKRGSIETMTVTDLTERVERLEAELEWTRDLGRRVALLEKRPDTRLPVHADVARRVTTRPRPAPSPVAASGARIGHDSSAFAPAPAPAKAAAAQRSISLEDLLGGRVLAWVGGLAVLAAVVFFCNLAISHGWLGEAARTAIAGTASLALGAFGVWLHERRGRTDAALTCVGTAAAAAFVTVAVASRAYELVPAAVGAGMALAVGATTTALALRWRSQTIGALGLIGGLASPLLAGADFDAGTIAVLAVATAAATVVSARMRWAWLGTAAILLPAVQWSVYVVDDAGTIGALATLCVFGVLGSVAAVGHDLRRNAGRLRASSAFLLAIHALILAAAGWYGLEQAAGHGLADAWLVALAVGHLGLGLLLRRRIQGADDLALLAFAIGTLLADVALARLMDGAPAALGWTATATALGFATLARRGAQIRGSRLVGVLRPGDAVAARAGLGGHLALALALVVITPGGPSNGELTIDGAGMLLGLAATCLASARILGRERRKWQMALDALAIAAVAWLAGDAVHGPALALVWAVEAVALIGIARRTNDEVAGVGALALLSLAAGHALFFEATPAALSAGVSDLAGAAVALGAVLGVVVILARGGVGEHLEELLGGRSHVRPAFAATAGVLALYLASIALVTAIVATGDAGASAALDLPARQLAQVALSALWAIVGVGVLVAGLRGDHAPLRRGALALLVVTIAKVFVFDTAQLDGVERAGSFLALGLLLLSGAFAWQRARPRLEA
jgi:uncharacterized membrane protein